MCTKTKTSFGCGHSIKDRVPCGDPNCDGVDKYAFLREGDCQACRSGGEFVTRGRDGRGRYARQINRAREEDPSALSRHNRPTKIDISGGRGPWMPENRSAKAWDSPTRKMADSAWLDEHDDRISDLRDKFEQFSFSSKSSRDHSPTEQQYGKVFDDEEPVSPRTRTSKQRQAKPLPYEIKIVEDESDHYTRRERRRKNSHDDSEDSMPHYRESPASSRTHLKSKMVTPQSEYEFYAPIESKQSRRRHGARTEPQYARSFTYDSPVYGSPVTGGLYLDHYEMIQPQQYNFIYPRGYKRH